MVSLCMSLSLTLIVVTTNTYAHATCDSKADPACWREYVRVYSGMATVAFLLGGLGLYFNLDKVRAPPQARQLWPLRCGRWSAFLT